jgi:hypothetical protein
MNKSSPDQLNAPSLHGDRYRSFEKYAMSAILALLGTGQSSCSLLLDTSAQQCDVDGECTRRGGAFASTTCVNHVCVARPPVDEGGIASTVDAGGDGEDLDATVDPVWGCLGHVVMETPQTPTIKISIPFYDLITGQVITNITARTCAKIDVSCSNPLSASVEADAAGVVKLEVPARFDGYALVLSKMTGDSGPPALIPSLVFFNPPQVRDNTYDKIPLFTPDQLILLAATQNNTIDPMLGTVFAGTQDCSGKAVAGVSWVPSRTADSSKRFYLIKGLPDEAALATDESGQGGMINAPTGTMSLTATLHATGQPAGFATLLVRAGYASYTYMAPTP